MPFFVNKMKRHLLKMNNKSLHYLLQISTINGSVSLNIPLLPEWTNEGHRKIDS